MIGVSSAKERAETYRQRAIELREMAAAAIYDDVRRQLIEMARQFDNLATSLETARFGG